MIQNMWVNLAATPPLPNFTVNLTSSLHLFPAGLSEEIRSNFNIMKELAVHTRMGPEPRATELLNFMKHMKGYVNCPHIKTFIACSNYY